MPQKIEPVNKHILVEIPEKKSNVYIPKDVTKSTHQGKVLAVAKDVEVDIKEGDEVIWEKFAESAIDHIKDYNGKTATLITSKVVMGIWRSK